MAASISFSGSCVHRSLLQAPTSSNPTHRKTKTKSNKQKTQVFTPAQGPGPGTWPCLPLSPVFLCWPDLIFISQVHNSGKASDPQILFCRVGVSFPHSIVTPQEASSARSPLVVPFAIQRAQEAVTGTRFPSLQHCLLLGSHASSRSSCACIKWMFPEDQAFFPCWVLCSFPAPARPSPGTLGEPRHGTVWWSAFTFQRRAGISGRAASLSRAAPSPR